MRALVISGGGSKGAFAGGFSEYLINEKGNDYQILIGCSTGSLIVPFLSIGAIDQIKEIYTNVTQKDIYNICPFTIKMNEDGSVQSGINHFNTIKMFFKRKKTFGETKNLRKTIDKFYTDAIHNQIVSNRKHVVATVSNLNTQRIEYKHAVDYAREDFIDWMWASCSFVPFMSMVEKNGYDYADGGFGNYIPIEEALSLGATEVDVIVLRPRHQFAQKAKSTNAFEVILNSLQFMLYQLGRHDLLVGHLESIYNENVKVKFYFTPTLLTKHSFYFNPNLMREWWNQGYQYAESIFNPSD